MLSKKSATPLAFTIKPSRIATALYLVLTFATCVLVLTLTLPFVVQVLLVSLLCGWVVYVLAIEWRIHGIRAVANVRWQGENCWWVTYHDGEECEANLVGDSLSLPFLIVLNFNLVNRNKKQTVCLFKDSVNDDIHRRLRVKLKTIISNILNR